jgi:hypothetical protein
VAIERASVNIRQRKGFFPKRAFLLFALPTFSFSNFSWRRGDRQERERKGTEEEACLAIGQGAEDPEEQARAIPDAREPIPAPGHPRPRRAGRFGLSTAADSVGSGQEPVGGGLEDGRDGGRGGARRG